MQEAYTSKHQTMDEASDYEPSRCLNFFTSG